ncbi:MAG: sigma-70 family RNA polymerase sigma factor [Brevibacterium sp.]
MIQEFEGHRARLTAMATRMLSSRSDAEDAVQESWFRLARQTDRGIDDLGAWLTRVVSRICIDILRRRRSHGGSALDIWEHEATIAVDEDGPEDHAAHAESLGLAVVIVLEELKPEERIAFVLHDVFAIPFSEVGVVIDRSADAAKMAASRARRKVSGVPEPDGDLSQRRRVVDAFLAAARDGDFDELLRLLDPDITWHRFTAHGRTVQLGATDVLSAIRRGDASKIEIRRVSVNGEPGILVLSASARPLGLMSCTVAGGRLVDIVSIVDQQWLSRLDLPHPPPG